MTLGDLIAILDQLHPQMPRLVISLLVVLAIVIVYKLLSRSLSRASKRLEFDPHVENSARLMLRVVTIVATSAILFTMFEIPATWLVSGSALVGAALGFGSSQTINNIVAGFYVIISRPFRVKDYVKIGDLEGQVEEITINYTKLYTPSFNLLHVPNVQVMSSRVLNCTHEGFIRYTFSLAFPHGISNEDIIRKCIEPAIEEFHEKHRDKQLRRPEAYFETTSHLGRSFKIRIFIPKGEARTLYILQPELSDMIINRWDIERKK